MHDNDKAGKTYWDRLWDTTSLPRPLYPEKREVTAFWDNYVNWRTHHYLVSVFGRDATSGKRLLEIGCARSVWLPYFASQFGMQVSGLDYSEIGCDSARRILEREKIKGDIIQADLFDPPERCIGAYDYVISFGVLEHFKNTDSALASIKNFLKPGGVLITNIPNLKGLPGWLQKRLDREVYDIHVPMSNVDLIRSHKENGFNIIDCRYFLFLNLGVLVYDRYRNQLLYPFLHKSIVRLTKLCWVFEDKLPWLFRPNRFTSPYIYCVAQKIST